MFQVIETLFDKQKNVIASGVYRAKDIHQANEIADYWRNANLKFGGEEGVGFTIEIKKSA